MRRSVLLVMLVGCGGGDAKPDAFIPQGPEYDFSCVGNMSGTVPTLITLDATLFDVTTLPINPVPPLANAMITARTLTDNTVVGMATTDMDGKASLEVTTTGTPARLAYTIEAAGLLKTLDFASLAPWQSGPNFFLAAGASRANALASALGQTLDAGKGVLEVWSFDCSAKGELPAATLQLDGADVSWAMFGGVGVWVPRAMTLGHLPNLNFGSIAGTVNVAPGTHTVTVTAGSRTVTSTAIVEAGAWTVLFISPGQPL